MRIILSTSEKLSIALERQGFTQKELAKKIGVSQATISKKFKYNDWRESDLKEICEIIGVNLEIAIQFNDSKMTHQFIGFSCPIS